MEPGYLRFLEVLLVRVLGGMGYVAKVVTGDSQTLQFDIIRGSDRILVSPTRENFNAVLLNTITLIALFGAPPGSFKPRTLARLAIALPALLLYQVLFTAHIIILALPSPDMKSPQSSFLPMLIGGRTLVPLLLWLSLHPWVYGQLSRLMRRPAASPAATVRA